MTKRIFTLLLLVGLCFGGWALIIKDYKTGGSEYKQFIEEAEDCYEKKIYDDALENYRAALEIRPKDRTALLGIANTYYSTGEYSQSVLYCEKLLSVKKDDDEARLLAAHSYEKDGEYSSAAKMLEQCKRTRETDSFLKELRARFELKYVAAKEPKSWFNLETGSAAVLKENDLATVYTDGGKKLIGGAFSYIGKTSDEEILYPCVNEGQWCYIDKSGKRRLVPETRYDYLGPFCDGLAVAKRDGVYGYIDKDLNEYLFDLENAYNFSAGMATIIKDGTVRIVDTKLAVVASTTYKGVTPNEYGDTLFDGLFIAFDGETDVLCKAGSSPQELFKAEDIRSPLSTGEPLAFRRDGKWGYVSKEGKVELEARYFDANSFSNGFGAVKIDSKWGYIDKEGTVVIPENFEFAGPVSKQGTAWVSNEAGYALMTICVFNK